MRHQAAAATFRAYVDLVHQVTGCVTPERLEVGTRGRLLPHTPIALALRDLQPVPLRAVPPISFAVALNVRIDEDQSSDRGAFRVETIQYFYRFTDDEGREILGFHWNPNAIGASSVAFPHLHVGRAITAGQSAIRPRDFHKAHIPTGVVTLPAIVRLAITEFGVTPLRRNWEDVLLRAESVRAQSAPSVS